jgi:hypothetical protein
MKKIFCLFLIAAAFKANAQKSILFKMKYLPDHSYAMNTNMTMKFNVTLSGDDNVIQKIESQGITQPILANMDMAMSGNTKTGKTGANGAFPMTTTFKLDSMKVKVGANAIPMPGNLNSQTKIYGHVSPDGKFKADSISGKAITDTAEKKVTQLMNAVQNKVKFPDHALKIGDSFTQDVPLNLPMADNSDGQTDVKATYTLTAIKDGNAYFDMVQNADIKLNIKGVGLTISGAGTGKLIFNLKNSFPTDYKTTLTMKVDGSINTLVIKGSAVIDGEYKYTIN